MSSTQSPAPGDDIRIQGLTWPKLLTIIGAVLAAAGALIYVLLGVVYAGIQEKYDSLNARVQSIDSAFHSTLASGVAVQDLLAKAPTLEQTINDTRVDVAAVKGQITSLQGQITSLQGQITSLQTDFGIMKQQVQAVQATTSATQARLIHLEDLMPQSIKEPIPK